jgi:hypothetical protein
MNTQPQVFENLDEKVIRSNPTIMSEEEMKTDTIVVDDEEERNVLRKIDLQ